MDQNRGEPHGASSSPLRRRRCSRRTCGEIPVRCLRWLLTRLDFLMMECMLSLEILSMNVSSSPFLYFTTADSRGRAGHKERAGNERKQQWRLGGIFFFTQIFPALVLVDVDVDLLDGQQRLRQLGPVVVVLRRGSQQLHQQQRVAHHSLHRLDEEGAQVDVVGLPPGSNPEGNTDRPFRRPGNKLGARENEQLRPLIPPQNTFWFSCSLQKCLLGKIMRSFKPPMMFSRCHRRAVCSDDDDQNSSGSGRHSET